jgi:hypothetical protein
MGHPGNERLSISQTVFVDTQKTKYLYGYVFAARCDSGRHYRFDAMHPMKRSGRPFHRIGKL